MIISYIKNLPAVKAPSGGLMQHMHANRHEPISKDSDSGFPLCIIFVALKTQRCILANKVR